MKVFQLAPRLATIGIAVGTAMVSFGAFPSRAQTASAAATHIEGYYRDLMPTVRQAGRLTVRERDKRFAPAITTAFDLGTMTRLAVGPSWKGFSPAQQGAVQNAFTRFIVADYASQINNYSGESFVVDPQTTPETRGGGEVVKTRLLQPGGKTVSINYLVRGGRVIDPASGTDALLDVVVQGGLIVGLMAVLIYDALGQVEGVITRRIGLRLQE